MMIKYFKGGFGCHQDGRGVMCGVFWLIRHVSPLLHSHLFPLPNSSHTNTSTAVLVIPHLNVPLLLSLSLSLTHTPDQYQ